MGIEYHKVLHGSNCTMCIHWRLSTSTRDLQGGIVGLWVCMFGDVGKGWRSPTHQHLLITATLLFELLFFKCVMIVISDSQSAIDPSLYFLENGTASLILLESRESGSPTTVATSFNPDLVPSLQSHFIQIHPQKRNTNQCTSQTSAKM